jgi:hypothetical protein
LFLWNTSQHRLSYNRLKSGYLCQQDEVFMTHCLDEIPDSIQQSSLFDIQDVLK